MRAFDPFPIIYSADVARSVAFYAEAFGFEQAFRWPLEGAPTFAYLKLEPSGIGIARHRDNGDHGLATAASGPARFELCLYVDDMDEACARLEALGAPQLRPPQDEEWGERRAYYADPDGNPVHLAMRLDR